ncbi:hypothetical protein [Hyphococcus luteus]|uniref:hypothetical protein n=1 Tax=Hyphococcus luteus TaxID=2058213 RepID=UPI0013FDC31E|nr:hypothetical protein [Marinicaulis flavus]
MTIRSFQNLFQINGLQLKSAETAMDGGRIGDPNPTAVPQGMVSTQIASKRKW